MRSRLRSSVLFCAWALISAACSLIAGLEDRTLVSNVDASVEGGVDAAPDVQRTFCDDVDAYLCDDFDDPERILGKRWRGVPLLGIGSTTLLGSTSLTLVDDVTAKSSPTLLEMNFEDTDASGVTTAFLTHEIADAQNAAALEVSFEMQLADLVDLRNSNFEWQDSGPNPELLNVTKISVTAIATLTSELKRYAVGLAVGTDSLLMIEEVEQDPVTNYALASATRFSDFGDNAWIRLHLVSGDREAVLERAKREGRNPECPADAGTVSVAWASVSAPPGASGCLASDERYHPIVRGTLYGVAVGGSGLDPMRARVRFDSVRIDLIYW